MRSVYTLTIRPRRVLAWLGGGAVAAAGVLLALFLAQASMLGWVGAQLLHEDPMAAADVIVVLSGGTPAREIEAAVAGQEHAAERVIRVAEAHLLPSVLRLGPWMDG